MQETAKIIDKLKELEVWEKVVNAGIIKKSVITTYKAQKTFAEHRSKGEKVMDSVSKTADSLGISDEYAYKLVRKD